MRIAYLANVRIPTERAYGLQIMKTCEALANAGADVTLVTPFRRNTLTDEAFSYYNVSPVFRLLTLRTPDLVSFGPLGFLLSTFFFAEAARWKKEFFEADLVYSRDALVLIQYVLLQKPFVFEAHAKPSFASRVVAKKARNVVVISNGLRRAYEAAGIPPERITVAPDAVDEHLFDGVPDRFAARIALKLPSEASIVVYAGHLYPRKGAVTLARAATHLSGIEIVFVGGTSTDIAAFKKEWGVQKNIRIVGHVPHAQVAWYLRAADVLVLPNSGKDTDSAEFTSPMKLFEYMASGTPIVASDVLSLREVLNDGTAMLVSPDDAQALAEAVSGALSNREAMGEKAEKALARVKDYTWTERAKRILTTC
ncbi:MAG: hypothetical protein QG636_107 [Patescibacteria group bacterium]|nr:hypothetical protein [Patescibacteria group bacterium]